MVWAAWGEGQLPWCVEGFPKAPWSHFIQPMPTVGRKMRLALPCLGLDALGAGLLEINWDAFEVAYAHDIDASLAQALVLMHGERAACFQIGHHGDLLACNVQEWDRVDWVIAGPPCPPFSTIGDHKLAPQDVPRERLFRKVIEIIIHQGKLRCFGFVIEMVAGIAHRFREQNYLSAWLQTLAEQAPMYRIHVWALNSERYLPQHRPRVYTVGVLRELVGDLGMPPPAPHMAASCRASLGELLNKGLKPVDESHLSPQQKENLSMMKPYLFHRWATSPSPGRCHGESGRFSPPIFCISVDRNPEKKFGSYFRCDDAVPTLRTGNEMLWLLKFAADGSVILSRCLHPVERLALQGFAPELALCMSKQTLVRATGNSFTVPVVVDVFQRCMDAISCSPILGVEMWKKPRKRADEMAALLAKRRRINELREGIALLDAELRLEESHFRLLNLRMGY